MSKLCLKVMNHNKILLSSGIGFLQEGLHYPLTNLKKWIFYIIFWFWIKRFKIFEAYQQEYSS